MPTLQTNDATGQVVLFGNPACPPAPRRGYTIRTVDALPPGPGKLVWREGTGLVRVVPAPSAQQVFDDAVAAGYTVPASSRPWCSTWATRRARSSRGCWCCSTS